MSCSAMGPPQHAAGTISLSAGAPGKTYLRKDKNDRGKKEIMHACMRNNPANSKVREKEGEESASSTRADIHLQQVERIMVDQIFPCSPWRRL